MITIEDDSQTKKEKNILELDLQRFESWFLSDFECEAVQRLKSLLQKLIILWNHRFKNSLYKSATSRIYAILALHGVPYRIPKLKDIMYPHFYLKYLPRTNLMELFNEISILEGGFREHLWVNEHMELGSQCFPNSISYASWTYRLERYVLWKLAATRNHRGVTVYLSNMPTMRSLSTIYFRTSKHPDQFLDRPIYAMMALHVTISSDWNLISLRNLGDRIFQLAYFLSISQANVFAENSIVAHLTEFLTTSLVYDANTAAEKIISLERNINRLNLSAKYKTSWRWYHSITQFCKWKNGISHDSASSIVRILSETLDGDRLPDTTQLWIDAILYICKTTDEVEDELSDVVEKCCNSPILASHLAKRLRSLEKQEELHIVVEQSCSSESYKMHPSDDIWLDFVDVRINAPQKYGINVMNHCVERLFSFLDYGSNRSNERAWRLLWNGVQLVSPELHSLWEERKRWWLRFHNISLSKEAESSRREVLNALLAELR